MFQKKKKIVEKIKTHFMSRNFLFFFRKSWKNIVQPGRPQVTIRRMRTACSIRNATNIFSQYVVLTPFARQQWLHERASVLRYTILSVLQIISAI